MKTNPRCIKIETVEDCSPALLLGCKQGRKNRKHTIERNMVFKTAQ